MLIAPSNEIERSTRTMMEGEERVDVERRGRRVDGRRCTRRETNSEATQMMAIMMHCVPANVLMCSHCLSVSPRVSASSSSLSLSSSSSTESQSIISSPSPSMLTSSSTALASSRLSRPILLSASSPSLLSSRRCISSSSFSSASFVRRFSSSSSSADAKPPTVFVCGGSGALGASMISTFKSAGWRTVCLDYLSNPISDVNITISPSKDWRANLASADAALGAGSVDGTDVDKSISVMIHCAGSWQGGSASADTFASSVDAMIDINLKSAVTTASLAANHLTESGAGLLVITGAAAALSPTPGMLAYGMSKVATHHLVSSLAQPDGGLTNATVVCMLPTMIDTPSNRLFAASPADYDNWTAPSDFAKLTLSFAQQLQSKVKAAKQTSIDAKKSTIVDGVDHSNAVLSNGGFYMFKTANGQTTITRAKCMESSNTTNCPSCVSKCTCTR